MIKPALYRYKPKIRWMTYIVLGKVFLVVSLMSVVPLGVPLFPQKFLLHLEAPPAMAHYIAKENGLDPKLVKAVIKVESEWNPRAVSKKGALGLMQVMPATAKDFGMPNKPEDLFNPIQNVNTGCRILKGYILRTGGVKEGLNRYSGGGGKPYYDRVMKAMGK